jgi:hypothetical protein
MGVSEAAELFFMVAITDSIGGDAISKRIQEQLQEHVGRAGLTLSTSYRALPHTKRDSKESTEEYLEHVAAGIQELIKIEISSRMVVNA